MTEKIRFTSILKQLAALFLAGLILTGWITYSSQLFKTETSVKDQKETIAAEVAEETKLAIMEYEAYKWLFRYWYSHSADLDIEYDAAYNNGTKTVEKVKSFAERHPETHLKYVSEYDLLGMTEEDRKLYAEIAYSWLTDRIDQIKNVHDVDYLFVVMTEEPYDEQFFVLSGAYPGAVRGTDYEEVYTLGVTSAVGQSQQKAMENAIKNRNHLADAGNYLDFYSFLDRAGGTPILVGLTYDLTSINKQIQSETRNDTAAAVLGQLGLSVICMLMVYFLALRPLKTVQANIRRYRETKDGLAVKADLSRVNSKNEIGELTKDIIELTEEIDNYVDEIETITSEKQRIESELDMARRIQLSMMPNLFPPFPERKEFYLHAYVDPAREVGGDFYDYFFIDDDHLCLVIADVSGKGVPAALFMMAAKIILKSSAMQGKSPAEILTATNRQVCENNPQDMFVTTWLGILELSTGKLTAANAGHEYPAVKRAGGRFEVIKSKHSLFIGGMEDVTYKEYELYMEPGDQIFLYTDGLPEATDADGKMFGIDRMTDALNEYIDERPRAVIEGMRESVNGFVKDAEQFDDITMMCLEYKGKI
ncbi:MAG: PP2C family protein-serine/threonine phosphatase [Firmicutes bacterium]|nr:PP2C family protein-serine/threonine phosphatase [Bacillota bacterium]